MEQQCPEGCRSRWTRAEQEHDEQEEKSVKYTWLRKKQYWAGKIYGA